MTVEINTSVNTDWSSKAVIYRDEERIGIGVQRPPARFAAFAGTIGGVRQRIVFAPSHTKRPFRLLRGSA